MRIYTATFVLICAIPLSGCAAGIVHSVCEANRTKQDLRTLGYEAKIEVLVDGETSVTTQTFSCTPSGYYCGGGDWHAQFPKRDMSGFSITTGKGELNISLPSCPQPGTVREEWVAPEYISARLVQAEDSYRFNLAELQQNSAPTIAGARVTSYAFRQLEQRD